MVFCSFFFFGPDNGYVRVSHLKVRVNLYSLAHLLFSSTYKLSMFMLHASIIFNSEY